MKHLTILVPQGQNNLSSVVGPFKIFNRANATFEQAGRDKVFDIELVGTNDKVDFYQGLFTVNTQKNILNIDKTDLIIIPSLNHNYESVFTGSEDLTAWIYDQYKAGTDYRSLYVEAKKIITHPMKIKASF